jgi:hypothetical protein
VWDLTIIARRVVRTPFYINEIYQLDKLRNLERSS